MQNYERASVVGAELKLVLKHFGKSLGWFLGDIARHYLYNTLLR